MTIDQSLKRDLGQRHQQSKQQSTNQEDSNVDLDQQIASSSKQVLLHKIDFVPAKKSFSLNLDNLRSKYTPLNPSKKDAVKLQSKFEDKKQRENSMGKGSSNENVANDGIPLPKTVLFPSEKLKVEWQKVYRVGSGLMNLGNTCFLNSTLQCLTYTPPLVNYLMSQQHSQSCREPGFCMICELQRHVARAFHQSGSVIRPMIIIQKIKNIGKQFRYGHQEDAHEFLRCITEAMQKASLSGYDKLDRYSKETTLVHQIFGGYYRSRVQCLKCQEKSDTHDPFLDICIDIKHVSTVIRALERLVKPETLDNDNMYMCKRCKVKVPALKRFTVHRAPNILTLSLKRFDFHRYSGSKITKDVKYPEVLDLRPYMSQRSGPAIIYRLYAVLVHHGYSCNSGHYYCYVKAPNDSWYCMNDSSVTQSNQRTVLDQEAYILFYMRKPSGKAQQNSDKGWNQSGSTYTSSKFMNKSASATVSSTSNPVNGPVGKPIVRPKPQTPVAAHSKPRPILSGSPSVRPRPANRPTTIPEPGKREKVQFNLSVKPKTPQSQSSVSMKNTQAHTEPANAVSISVTPVKPVNGSGDTALVPYTGDSDESSEDYDDTVARLSNLPLKDEKDSKRVVAKQETETKTESAKSTDKEKTEKSTISVKVEVEQPLVSASESSLPEREKKDSEKVAEKTPSDSDAREKKETVDQSARKQTPKEQNAGDDKNDKTQNMKPPEKTTPVGAKSIATFAGNVAVNRTPGSSHNTPLKLTLSKVSSFKVNATSAAWKINDCESQISPSLASDSSNHSMNSTGGEWTVIDKKDAPMTPKVAEFAHPGWIVRTAEEFKKHEEEIKAKEEKEKEMKQESGSEDLEKSKGSPLKKCSRLERQYSCPVSVSLLHGAGQKLLHRQLSNGGVKRQRTYSSSSHDSLTSGGTNRGDAAQHKHSKKRKYEKLEDKERTEKQRRSESDNEEPDEQENSVSTEKIPLLNGSNKVSKKHKKHKKKKKKKSRERYEEESLRHRKHSDDSDYEDHRKERKKKKKHKHKKHREDTLPMLKEESESENSERTSRKTNGDHSTSKKEKPKAPTQHWDHHVRDGYKRLRDNDDESSQSKSWDGTKSSAAVDELMSRSNSKGYGVQVPSWDGGKSIVEQDAEKDRDFRKRRSDDDYDEDYDRGKVKKVKHRKSEDFKYSYKSLNRFQYEQNMRNRGFRDKNFRPSFGRSHSWNPGYRRHSNKY
ncbi:ubiquitin carboxyl-terminal hydrolase 36-like [Ptychodera flava]|uniref:ubiquitin carboxyl-terminal hydrolase 36-like n=1 Tax=Ptychodera flava TaxID=63121 RepID=UPI00396A1947